jgi:hypothetical protein
VPSIKRLLIYGTALPERLEAFYHRGFERLGVEVTLFDPAWVLDWFHAGRVRNRLSMPFQHLLVGRAFEAFYRQPRWDAVLVFKGYNLPRETIRMCRKRADVPWTMMNPDSPFDPGPGSSSQHIRESISEFDLYFIYSRRLIEPLREAGARDPRYIACGYDDALHFPAATRDDSLRRTIALVGTYDPLRSAVMNSIADLPVRIFGSGWERLPRTSPLRGKVSGPVTGEAMRRVTSSCLASLNLLRPQNIGAHNMRTFEVPAMRGLLLATRSEEQQELFAEGEASLMFDGPHELRSVIARLLEGDFDIEALRSEAHARVQGLTYQLRAREMLTAIEQL